MTLKDFFIKYPKIAIAFSGGTDSAYLCYMAKKYAKEMTAIYVSTAFQKMQFVFAKNMRFR